MVNTRVNSSHSPLAIEGLSRSHGVAFQVVFLPLILLTLGGNFLVCVLIISSRQIRVSGLNRLLLNLAAADLFFGVAAAVFYVGQVYIFYSSHLFIKELEDTVCKGIFFSLDATTRVSLLTLAIISIERYLLILRPLKYRLHLTKRNLNCFITAIWIISLSFSAPLTFLLHSNEGIPLEITDDYGVFCIHLVPDELQSFVVNLVNIFAINLPCTFAVVCSFIKIIMTLWSAVTPDVQASSALLKSRRRVTKILCSVTVSFTLCWIPIAVLEGLYLSGFERFGFGPLFGIFFLCAVNTSLNPIVYYIQSRLFRRRLNALFRRG